MRSCWDTDIDNHFISELNRLHQLNLGLQELTRSSAVLESHI